MASSSNQQQQQMPTSPPTASQHWEGDGTLHSYCYDYMRKRGWSETASAFAVDAGINEEEWNGPPIEAPQGLLYEWWSVFWDVFIARSQKTGQRNIMADTYVEAMRTKVDPLQVHFSGAPGATISLPRSLAHPPRLPPGALQHPPQHPQQGQVPRPSYTNPGQMHVLQQQQLQDQLQASGRGGGLTPGGAPIRLTLQQQQHQQQMQQQNQFHPPPPPSTPGPQQMHSQYPQSQPPTPQQQQQQLQYPPSSIPPSQSYQQNQQQVYHQPSRPSSAQSSPHLAHSPHPFAKTPNPGQQQLPPGLNRDPNQGMQISPAFMQALAAVGLSGRDPEGLNTDEHAAVSNQMRRGGQPLAAGQQGGPPPQNYRGPPQQQMSRPGPPQRLQSEQGRIPGGGVPYPGQQQQQQQQQMQERYTQQQMMHQQQQQQQRDLQQQQQQQQQRGQVGGRNDMVSGGQYVIPGSSQIGSPSSPAYSNAASPFATPIQQHLPMPPPLNNIGSQASPPPTFVPPPQPIRPVTATTAKGKKVAAAAAAATAAAAAANNVNGPISVAAKRTSSGSLEDPSPRSRKRARGTTKEEGGDGSLPSQGPETPRFDGSGPSSPALSVSGIPNQSGNTPSYRPDSSLGNGSHDPSRALEPVSIGVTANARMLAQQQQTAERLGNSVPSSNHSMEQLDHEELQNGDNGTVNHLNLHQNGNHPNMNGMISRPSSSASNNNNSYLSTTVPSFTHIEPHKLSPAHSPRPPSIPTSDLYTLGPQSPSMTLPMSIAIPPPLPPGAFQLVNGADLTPGGSRPFAGAHLSNPLPLSNLPGGGALNHLNNNHMLQNDHTPMNHLNSMVAGGGGGGLPSNNGPISSAMDLNLSGLDSTSNNLIQDGTNTSTSNPNFNQSGYPGEELFTDLSGLDFSFDQFIDQDLFEPGGRDQG